MFSKGSAVAGSSKQGHWVYWKFVAFFNPNTINCYRVEDWTLVHCDSMHVCTQMNRQKHFTGYYKASLMFMTDINSLYFFLTWIESYCLLLLFPTTRPLKPSIMYNVILYFSLLIVAQAHHVAKIICTPCPHSLAYFWSGVDFENNSVHPILWQ